MSNSINYWHIQLHPNAMNWTETDIYKILDKGLIGCSGSPISTFKKLSIGDIVLVRHGSKVLAVVKVISEPEITPENIKSPWIWFDECCKVEVIKKFQNISVGGKGWYLPTTLQQIRPDNSIAYDFVRDLLTK